MTRRCTSILTFVAALPLLAFAAQPAAIAIVNVSIVPMDREGVVAGQTVLVTDGKITAVGPANAIKVPAGAQRIDGAGKFLMPGLADMHPPVGFEFAVRGGLKSVEHVIPFAFATIAVGQRADLLLLEANPLDNVANAKRRAGVLVRGQWFDEADLQRQRK